MNLTKKQLIVLDFIYDYKVKNKICPSLVEIADFMNISTVTVYEHLKALETKHIIRKERHMARSVEIIDPIYLKEKANVSPENDILQSLLTQLRSEASKIIDAKAFIVDLKDQIGIDCNPNIKTEDDIIRGWAKDETQSGINLNNRFNHDVARLLVLKELI